MADGGFRIGWFAKRFTPDVASVRLRLLGPIAALRARGVEIEQWHAMRADCYDALIISKSFTRSGLNVARTASASGKPIVVDMCDNDLEKADRKRRPAKRARIVEMLERSTLVTVPTSGLAAQIAAELPGVAHKLRLVPDMLDDTDGLSTTPSLLDSWRLARLGRFLAAHPSALHCVWFGNSSGEASGFAHLAAIVPRLERFARTRAMTLTVISNDRGRYRRAARTWGMPHLYLPWSLASFGAALAMHRVALIPIRRNGYTVGKSINRPATAILAGLGVVADAIDSYEELRAFVALDDWEKGLVRYADHWDEERPRLAAARSHLTGRYGTERAAERWAGVLAEITPPN